MLVSHNEMSYVRHTPKSRGSMGHVNRMWTESLLLQWGQTILSLLWGVDIDAPLGREIAGGYWVYHPTLERWLVTTTRLRRKGGKDAPISCGLAWGDNTPEELGGQGRGLGRKLGAKDRTQAVKKQCPGLLEAIKKLGGGR